MRKIHHLQHTWSYYYHFLKLDKIPLTMKLLSLMLILSINIGFAAHSYAQETTLSLAFNNKKVVEVLDEIEKQSEFRFYYNSKLVDVDRTVSVKVTKRTVFSILDEIFTGHGVEYKVLDKDIILTQKEKPETTNNLSISQQQNIVSGVVKDETGETLSGVSVIIKGTTIGTMTDMDGAYSINVPNKETVLVFSFIGFSKEEAVVGSLKTINIVLKEEIREMDEVVVIGYSTVKRANLAGAVSTADSKVFQSRPVLNTANALQGEVPGLTIIRNGGAPGSSATIRVRDVSSLNGGIPLVLIDGAEGDINMINSADIESISVLKDGTAAIYGARAADGVILVTTKSGRKNQKLRVTLDAYYSIKKPALIKKPASLYQHAEMALEITDGSFPVEYTRDELPLIAQGSDKVIPSSDWGRWSGYPKFYKNQDWSDMMIGNGAIQNYNVSFSGGGEKYSYLISLGYQSEDGLLKYGVDNDKRYFVRAKSNIQILSNLSYDINLSYEASDRKYSSAISEGQNIWEIIYKTRSWTPMYNPAGRFYAFEGFDNPAQVMEEGGESTHTTGSFTFNNSLIWQVIDGLNIIGRAIVRKSDADKNIINKYTPIYNWEDVNHRIKRTPNSVERNYAKTTSKNFTLYGEYKKTFADKHEIGLMAGGAHESANYDFFSAKRINFDQQDLMSINLGSTDNQEANGTGYAWTINSFFSRVNYAFANKYLIEGTLRADGSSRYAKGHRWGWFPGVSVAWRLGEEQLMKNLNIFDDLKLRASYGEMGNQLGNAYYDYIAFMAINRSGGKDVYYPFGNGLKGQMYKAKNLVSTERTWETIHTTDIGLDFSILNNRLYGSFDYFWKENKNMLILKSYPKMLGIDPPTTNDGHLKINGWEVAIGWRDRIGNVSYSVRGSLSDAKNEMVERAGDQLIQLGLNDSPKGYPLNSYFGYEFDGIIQTEQELQEYKAHFKNGGIPGDLAVGDAKYKDLDGDGKLTTLGNGEAGSGDVKYLGDLNPRYTFGLNLNIEYKGIDLGAFFQGVGRRTMFLEGEARMPFPQPWYQSSEYWYGKTWTAERTDAKYPAITSKDKRNYNYQYSTNTKHNVAYIRMKNLQVGYTIPKRYTEKIKLEKIRVYFSAEDLFEIHNAPKGWDPEDIGIRGDGIEQPSIISYPFARNFSFGASIVF